MSASHNLIDHILARLDKPGSAAIEDLSFTDVSEFTREIENFLDEIPGGFFIYKDNETQDIIYANRALIKICGCDDYRDFLDYTKGSFRHLVHESDYEAIQKSIERQIHKGPDKMDYVEYRIRRKDGVDRWIEDFGHIIHNDVLGDIFYVFVNDATEKLEKQFIEKAALISKQNARDREIDNLVKAFDNERMLTHQEQARRMEVIEGLSVNYESILYVNLDNNLVIPYRLSIRTKKQFDDNGPREYLWFIDDYVKSWVHPYDKTTVAAHLSPEFILKTIVGERRTFVVNYRCLVHGETQHIQLRMVNVGNDRAQYVIGFRNIDKELEQEAQQKRVLEDALARAQQSAVAKNTFLSSMSHDMRTPLNAIFGFAALARKKLDDPAAVENYLDKIESSAETLLDITEKVLTMSYSGGKTGDAVEIEFTLGKAIKGVYESFKRKAARKKIKFGYTLNGLERRKVLGDLDKLEQILIQLTDNAITFTKSGGSVNISVYEQQTLPNGFTEYSFKVSDTGIGIGEKTLPHIFDPFTREYDTTSLGKFGPGLGLTIVKNLTDHMGGRIETESAVGKGSKFTVTLGFRSPEKRVDARTNAQKILADIKKKRILIVEDNPLNLDIEIEVLEELGFATDSAENGKVAIDKLTANPDDYYGVIIMDIQMPVMDGREATEIIRKMPSRRLSRIPIIALSANAFESDKLLSAKAGIDAHLAKPLDVDQLLETMSQVLLSRMSAR